MSADRDPIEHLLASIADDTHADWEAAERGADPSRRARVESLRDVARVAEFSRRHQRSAPHGLGDPGAAPEPAHQQ